MSITKAITNRALTLVHALEERCYGDKTAKIVEDLCDLYLEHAEEKTIPGLQKVMLELGVDHAVSFSAVSARMFCYHRDKIYGKQTNTSGAKRGPKAKGPKARVITVDEILSVLGSLSSKDLARLEKALTKAQAKVA